MGLISILLGILAIGIIALIHEVGHYFFARRAGLKVLELSLGAGPKIAQFTKNDTLYTIRIIPFLAYVKIEGEGEEIKDASKKSDNADDNINEEKKDVESKDKSLSEASIFQRFLLYIGGVLFNLLTAVLILTLLGVFIGYNTEEVIIGSVKKDTPAYGVLKEKDQILEIDGIEISNHTDLENELAKHGDQEIELKVQRDSAEIKLNITPEFDEENDRYFLGFFFAKEKLDLFSSFSMSIKMISEYITETFKLLGNMITGQSGNGDGLVGIIGIVSISGDFTSRFSDYMLFIAIISIGMAIINILPIPALDGGKIVLLAVEKIIGRKINEKVESKLTLIGIAVLILIMVFTTINDIVRLFGG